MSDNSFTITFESDLPNSGGDVTVKTFRRKLEELEKALEALDKGVGDGKAQTEFLVTGLSHNSPATLTASAVPCVAPNENWINPFGELCNIFSSNSVETIIKNKTYKKAAWRHFSNLLTEDKGAKIGNIFCLGKPYKTTIARTRLKKAFGNIQLDLPKIKNFESAFNFPYSGVVKVIDVESEKPFFEIFMLMDSFKIRCYFSNRFSKKVAKSLNKKVGVMGIEQWEEGEVFPVSIEIGNMKILHSDKNVVREFIEAYGTEPELADGKAPADYIAEMRSGDLDG